MADSEEEIKNQVNKALASGASSKIARFALAALSGVIPGAGGIVSGIAGAWSEEEQNDFNRLLAAWLKLQEDEIREIGKTIIEVMIGIDQSNEEIRKRIESPEYLKLIKKAFRDWSAAESEEKRILIRNLLVNAASTKICTDDVIALFIKWIDTYSEAHFKVIKEIFNKSGITRKQIWEGIHGEIVKENSAEADLFKLLILDLNTGHVIRQHKEVDYYGNFIPQPYKKSVKGSGRSYTSAFDDEKQYELTELGQQFVSYTMNEIVPRIAQSA